MQGELYELYALRYGHHARRSSKLEGDHIVPGHDPLVVARYPAARPSVPDIVRLDLSLRN